MGKSPFPVHAHFTITCTCSYSEAEIEQKVSELRGKLTQSGYNTGTYKSSGGGDSHLMAEATKKKNEQLRAAFGIRDDYVDGSAFAFDTDRQALKAAKEEENLKEYVITLY